MRIRVNGIPAPQGSKKHVGHGIMVESSKAVGPWREAIRAETQRVLESGEAPPDGALDVLLTFWLPRPAGHFGKRGLLPSAPDFPAGRPDLDKLARAALDGLTAGGALRDDARAVTLTAEKLYTTDGYPPGLSAWIEAIPTGSSRSVLPRGELTP